MARALFAFVWILIVVQRLLELRLSARHEAALESRGGFAVQGSLLFPIVIAQVVWLGLWAWEVLVHGARPPAVWPLLAALAAAAEGLRWWAITSLGPRWTTRVFALPGQPLVTGGPYRWMSHPNYLAVAVETLALPLVFGAWRAATAGLLLYLFSLALRLPAERRAMGLALSETLDRDTSRP